MNKDEIKKTVQSWLNKNQPEGNKLVFACGSVGALIAIKQDSQIEWQTIWADDIIIYSDVINQYPIKIPKLVTLPTPTSANILTCHCGRIFTKRFALTNHKKVCKQTELEQPCETEQGAKDTIVHENGFSDESRAVTIAQDINVVVFSRSKGINMQLKE